MAVRAFSLEEYLFHHHGRGPNSVTRARSSSESVREPVGQGQGGGVEMTPPAITDEPSRRVIRRRTRSGTVRDRSP